MYPLRLAFAVLLRQLSADHIYQEKVEHGVLCCRWHPSEPFIPMSPRELTALIQQQQRCIDSQGKTINLLHQRLRGEIQ